VELAIPFTSKEWQKAPMREYYFPSSPWGTVYVAMENIISLTPRVGWRQDNRNGPNQESKFDFLATCQCLMKIDKGQQKIKIVCTNRQSNLWGSCQSTFSLCQHHPTLGVQLVLFPSLPSVFWYNLNSDHYFGVT